MVAGGGRCPHSPQKLSIYLRILVSFLQMSSKISMIHSHINCTLFLHRSRVHTFLSVSLNCLHEMIQSNTGCICLTFLHCVFSASSNRLHPPLCVFKRVLKEGAKSHWLHLFDFSPLCAFKSVLKTSAREDA